MTTALLAVGALLIFISLFAFIGIRLGNVKTGKD